MRAVIGGWLTLHARGSHFSDVFPVAFPPVFPDWKTQLARDVMVGGWTEFMFSRISAEPSSLPNSSQNHNDTVTSETFQRCLYDSDRSRVCDRPGSLARDLQNHGNPTLATGRYAGHLQPVGAQLTLMRFSVKAGYPPKSLTLIPELPVSSLGLVKGEQLIVNQNDRGQGTGSTPTRSATGTSDLGTVQQPSTRPSVPAKPATNEPDSIETEGGYLVHRVRV